MSNPVTGHSAAYIAELKKRLNGHRKWVGGLRGGIQADLSFYDMSQLPLSGASLRNAKLVGTSFARSTPKRSTKLIRKYLMPWSFAARVKSSAMLSSRPRRLSTAKPGRGSSPWAAAYFAPSSPNSRVRLRS